ncbi:MAG: SMP-30/gluconolactonase/LRE family protein [Burkholderiales bacterium]
MHALPIPLSALAFVGGGLSRPECVLATRAGTLYTADWRGGVAMIASDGAQTLYSARISEKRPLRPNGIALRRDGSFLLADLGDTLGGVYVLARDNTVRPFVERVDGVDLPPTNFVVEDTLGRVWITVSTRRAPRADAYRADVADGFIVVVDRRGARIAAEGLGYTNEALVSPDGRWLYVNETFGRRLSRFRVAADGALGPRETVTAFGHGTYPDGLAFDAEGHVWITSIVSNRVVRVAPDGAQTVMLEDADPAHVQWCEDAYLAGAMGRPHLDRAAGRVLRNISSLAFGGPGLRTAYLGCLLGDAIAHFSAPVAGHPPVHWTY